MAAQDAFSRRQYAYKHFSPTHRILYLSAIGARHTFRTIIPGRGPGRARERRVAARRALRALVRPSQAPFCQPPQTALWLGPPAGPRSLKAAEAEKR